jgi:hypothetical protein
MLNVVSQSSSAVSSAALFLLMPVGSDAQGPQYMSQHLTADVVSITCNPFGWQAANIPLG